MNKLFLLILSGVILASTASASYISLNTTSSLKFQDNSLMINVSSINKGDESAYNVQAEIRVGTKTILADKVTELPVNGVYKVNASLKVMVAKPGNYPLFLTMHYADANQYPFSALSCLSFAYQQETLSPVFGQLSSTTFSKQGKVKLVIKNTSDQPVKTRTYLVAPRELSYKSQPTEVLIDPRSEKSVEFPLENFSALAGSTYQVYAVSESEDEQSHYTSIAPSTVKVVASQAIYGMSYSLIFALLVILLVIFVGSQFFKKK